MKPTLTLLTALLLAPLAALQAVDGSGSLRPSNLRCEYQTNPQGMDVLQPRLSWVLQPRDPSARGLRQTAYQIHVASSPEMLAEGKADLWDSGREASDETLGITYAGRPLTSRNRCHWRVRVWDQDGRPSAWSEPAMWTMGLLRPEDWRAQWIADRAASQRRVVPPRYGWMCAIAQRADPPVKEPSFTTPNAVYEYGLDVPVWVEIDLRKEQTVDAVVFHPARDLERYPDEASHVFPLRFQVKAARAADGTDAVVVEDRTGADEPNPGRGARTYQFSPVQARYVRIQFTRLRQLRMDHYGVALAEIEVRSGGRNIAPGAAVRSSLTMRDWSPSDLVDGRTESVAGNLRKFSPTMLRKEFTLKPGIRRATAYFTAKGIYEFSLNGNPAGDGRVLAPESTDYRHRIQYQTYDVTDLLKPGANAIGILLSPGWYAGQLGFGGLFNRFTWGKFPQLLAQIEIEYDDGSRATVASDGTWTSTDQGPYVYSDFLDGQDYDARRELPGWDRASFKAKGWNPVAVDPAETDLVALNGQTGGAKRKPREPAHPALVAQMSEPLRVVRDVNPVAISEPRPGVFVFDLGQNIAGWCRLKVRAPAGTAVRLRHTEALEPDGMVNPSSLRSVQAVDTYIARGGGVEVFEPRMTQHGFRYVEVTGLPEKPRLEDLAGCLVRSASPEVGRFESSNPLLNRIMDAMRWTIEDNMLSVPTDYPQRDERMGWTGDGQLAAPAAACFMDMHGFYRKWVTDIRDGQLKDGRFPSAAPVGYGLFNFGPGWSDAGVTMPWLLHVLYDDRRVLEELLPAVRRWVDFVQAANSDGIYRNKRGGDWGDWLNGNTLLLPGWRAEGCSVPMELFATAIWARSTEIVAKMAETLGDSQAAAEYRQRHHRIKTAFQQEFLKPDGALTGDTQAGYALALHYGLIDDPMRHKVAGHLAEAVRSRGGHPTTGIVATRPLFEALSENGLHDDACRMILLREAPSLGYMIENGGTTIWERWDGYIKGRGYGHPRMNSFNHPALTSVASWVWRHLAGIAVDEASPGYKHFFIQPRSCDGVDWVRASYNSVRGPIAVEWKKESGGLNLTVSAPPNTTATVKLPDGTTKLLESGRHNLTMKGQKNP